jgi:hypothetical protein
MNALLAPAALLAVAILLAFTPIAPAAAVPVTAAIGGAVFLCMPPTRKRPRPLVAPPAREPDRHVLSIIRHKKSSVG